jgi:hypothetical protein
MNSPSAEQVRLSRVRAGLTQKQAASVVYVGERMWQRYEAGTYEMHPGLWELFRYKVFHVRPDPITAGD